MNFFLMLRLSFFMICVMFCFERCYQVFEVYLSQQTMISMNLKDINQENYPRLYNILYSNLMKLNTTFCSFSICQLSIRQALSWSVFQKYGINPVDYYYNHIWYSNTTKESNISARSVYEGLY